MSDLVERLRKNASQWRQSDAYFSDDEADLNIEAASRISQQDAELERLRRQVEEARAEHQFSLGLVDQAAAKLAETEKKFETADKLRVFWNDKATELAALYDREKAARQISIDEAAAEARKAAFMEAAEIAEGPPYKEHYRGDENSNWTSYSDYGRGRFAAADAIRAKAEETRT